MWAVANYRPFGLVHILAYIIKVKKLHLIRVTLLSLCGQDLFYQNITLSMVKTVNKIGFLLCRQYGMYPN